MRYLIGSLVVVLMASWPTLAFGAEAFAEAGQESAAPEPRKLTEQERRAQIEQRVQEILSSEVESKDYREPLRCLNDFDYEHIKLIDDRRVLFYGRGDKVWLNQWTTKHPCGGKYYKNYTIHLKKRQRRVCELDTIGFVDTSFGFRDLGVSCLLGKFEAITPEQAEFLMEAAAER